MSRLEAFAVSDQHALMGIRGLIVWTVRTVGLGLVIVAFFGLTAYWVYWYSTAKLHLSGQHVEGTIEGHFSKRNTSDIEYFHPVLTYAAPPGKKHKLRDESLEAASESLAQRWHGKKRTILIDRSDPGDAVAAVTLSPTNPSDMMGNLCGTTFGVAVLLIGMGMLVGSFFDPKKIATAFVTLAGVLFGLGVCIVGAATGYFAMQHATTYRTVQENGTEVEGTIVSFFHVGGGSNKAACSPLSNTRTIKAKSSRQNSGSLVSEGNLRRGSGLDSHTPCDITPKTRPQSSAIGIQAKFGSKSQWRSSLECLASWPFRSG